MFTVAPSGSTKLDILLETPTFSSTQSMVTGSVPDDDAVENAVSMAGAIAGNILYGETLPTKRRNSGRTTVTCMNKRKEHRERENGQRSHGTESGLRNNSGHQAENTNRRKLHDPLGHFIMTWKTPSQNLNSGSASS